MLKSNAVKDGVVYTLVYIALLLLVLFIPFLSFFLMFVLPIPFILYAYKYETRQTGIFFIAVLLLSTFFLIGITLPLTVFVGLGGIVIGISLRNRRKILETLAYGTMAYTVGLALVYVITQFIFQVNWSQEIQEGLNESLNTYMGFYDEFGDLSDEEREILSNQMNSMVDKVPTGMVIFGLFYAWITQLIGHKVIKRSEGVTFKFPKFREFTFPLALIWYFFIGVILTLIFPERGDMLYLVGDNLYALTGLLLSIQGLSFIFFFNHHKKWPKFIPYIVIVLFVLQPILLLYPLRILGIIDLGFHLRDRLSKKS
ncbi:YybS family protein [Aquisalibacillus elongatus]|uniref:Uncharacterized protein YybS (DUF2232 family) n=1 Tax=Aquisalibacillus elongatus TaxID=485577 RepID=A0A3N5B199_9BACI|nr:YybS family protein [Aquisalibacillus elongatus]RPF51114.1 uncharacterized protein YybS (DUF2232 family) [Aquisalibacillus elongatus]